jgi:hypothetical protein
MHIPNRHDATAYYRATGPLGNLRRRYRNRYKFIWADEISFGRASFYDVAFFQRPSTAQELEAIRILTRMNKPVIVDYDDLLFQVPTDNPAHGSYMNQATQTTIVEICKLATCIWVSTKELKRTLQLKGHSLNDKVYVVPNAIDDHHLLHGGKEAPAEKRTHSVLWRGSPTHERDILEYTPEIGDVASKHPRWSFVFAGYNPWFLTERMKGKQAVLSGALPVGEFMDFIYGVSPQVGMVPLHDSRFNRCKSNIAWLEMTWAGAAVLAPDWEEWRVPGIVTYHDPKSYGEALDWLLTIKEEERRELNRISWEHIQDHFLISVVNPIRDLTIKACLTNRWPKGYEPLFDPDTEAVMELQ